MLNVCLTKCHWWCGNSLQNKALACFQARPSSADTADASLSLSQTYANLLNFPCTGREFMWGKVTFKIEKEKKKSPFPQSMFYMKICCYISMLYLWCTYTNMTNKCWFITNFFLIFGEFLHVIEKLFDLLMFYSKFKIYSLFLIKVKLLRNWTFFFFCLFTTIYSSD